MSTGKQELLFKGNYEQSKNIVTKDFIDKQLVPYLQKNNILGKIIGQLVFPFFYIMLAVSMDYGRSYNIKPIIIGISCYAATIVVILLFSLFWGKILFVMMYNLFHTITIVLSCIPLLLMLLYIDNVLGIGIILFGVYFVIQLIILIYFIYRKNVIIKASIYDQKNGRVQVEKIDQITKKIASYGLPILAVVYIIKDIFSSIEQGMSYEGRLILPAIVVPIAILILSVFAIYYCFYGMFVPYFYIKKYKNEYERDYDIKIK